MHTPTAAIPLAMALAVGLSAQTQQKQPDPNQTVTITGCLKEETDVLKRPTAGTGNLGMSDEFVLTSSSIKLGAPSTETEPPTETKPTPPAPTGTSGTLEPGKIYRVTGDKEAELKTHVGHRVEIAGTFKHEYEARRELEAIGTTGKPPANMPEPTNMNTPEITIVSYYVLSEACGG